MMSEDELSHSSFANADVVREDTEFAMQSNLCRPESPSCPASFNFLEMTDILPYDDVSADFLSPVRRIQGDHDAESAFCCSSATRRCDGLSCMCKSRSRCSCGTAISVSSSQAYSSKKVSKRSCDLQRTTESACRSRGQTVAPEPKNSISSRSTSFHRKSEASFDLEHIKTALMSMEFDVLDHNTDSLVAFVMQIFYELKIDSALQINRSTFHRFVLNVRANMRDNAYHNWFHVVDVMQTVYSLGLQSGILPKMSDKDCLSLIVAALCHDLDHPGVSSTFLIQTRAPIASLYGMETDCLERYHSSCTAKLLSNPSGDGLLDSMCAEDRAEIMDRVLALILCTDMNRHQSYMTQLEDLVQESRGGHALDPDIQGRPVLAELLLKCADTSNVLKSPLVARRWGVRITDEFFQQGDLERSMGLNVTPACDRHTQSRVAMQTAFIDFIEPFYSRVGDLLPALRPLVHRLRRTRDMWTALPADDDDSLLSVDVSTIVLDDSDPGVLDRACGS